MAHGHAHKLPLACSVIAIVWISEAVKLILPHSISDSPPCPLLNLLTLRLSQGELSREMLKLHTVCLGLHKAEDEDQEAGTFAD
jgi:hypothetical protein